MRWCQRYLPLILNSCASSGITKSFRKRQQLVALPILANNKVSSLIEVLFKALRLEQLGVLVKEEEIPPHHYSCGDRGGVMGNTTISFFLGRQNENGVAFS